MPAVLEDGMFCKASYFIENEMGRLFSQLFIQSLANVTPGLNVKRGPRFPILQVSFPSFSIGCIPLTFRKCTA